MGDGEQAFGEQIDAEQRVAATTARINWRKLLALALFVMVLPTLLALLLDWWLGTMPMVTIVAIVLCFPTATYLVIRSALQEMERIIAEVAPPLPPDPPAQEGLSARVEVEHTPVAHDEVSTEVSAEASTKETEKAGPIP